jgi:hypothetical protein
LVALKLIERRPLPMTSRLRTFTVKLPLEYYTYLQRMAKREQVTVGWYLRDKVVKEHMRQDYNARKGADLLGPFTRTVKEYILTWQYGVIHIASSLPAADRRRRLEDLTWQAVQQAFAYSQTEDAAKNAKDRLSALTVLADLMRVERAVLNDEDDAFVEKLLEELDADNNELEKETPKSSERKTQT